jgi:hypothetical protein
MRFRLLVPVAVLFAALLPATASATHVQCGDVITQDTTLDSDLVDCPGDGVVIGASGIRLDLGRHLIDGTSGASRAGINNQAGHDGVTVTNGTIRDFGISVWLSNQQGGEASHLVTDNSIALDDSPDIRIERNVVRGIGVIEDSDRVLIRRNDVVDGGVIVAGFPPSPFTSRDRHPDDMIIDRNTIQPVVALFQVPNASVTRNRVLGSPSDSIGAGIYIRGSQGSALVERNEVSGAMTGISIFFTQAILTRNLVFENAGDGIWVQRGPFPESTDTRALIDRNRSERNGDDGIDVDVTSATVTISNNFASFNGDLGIEAMPTPIIDGGGNKAHGNGNPAQCLNVRCK